MEWNDGMLWMDTFAQQPNMVKLFLFCMLTVSINLKYCLQCWYNIPHAGHQNIKIYICVWNSFKIWETLFVILGRTTLPLNCSILKFSWILTPSVVPWPSAGMGTELSFLAWEWVGEGGEGWDGEEWEEEWGECTNPSSFLTISGSTVNIWGNCFSLKTNT